MASFLGACNIVEGRVVSKADGTSTIETAAGLLTTTQEPGTDNVIVGIRREELSFNSKAGDVNLIRGRILDRTFTGPQTEYAVEVNGTILHVWQPCSMVRRDTGENVILTCAPEAVMILEA